MEQPLRRARRCCRGEVSVTTQPDHRWLRFKAVRHLKKMVYCLWRQSGISKDDLLAFGDRQALEKMVYFNFETVRHLKR